MAQPSDLESRVAALETQVAALTEQVKSSKQDAAAARVLAGGADRDVSDATAAGLDQITGMLTTLLEQRGEDDR